MVGVMELLIQPKPTVHVILTSCVDNAVLTSLQLNTFICKKAGQTDLADRKYTGQEKTIIHNTLQIDIFQSMNSSINLLTSRSTIVTVNRNHQ